MTDLDGQLDSLLLEDANEKPTDKSIPKGDANVKPSNGKAENVRVMVRCRPMQPQEVDLCVEVNELDRCVEIDSRQFYYDQVFGINANNTEVYVKSAKQLVEFAFRGYNCTVFLYGQTGTGKTFTHSSLTTRAFEDLFSLIKSSNKQARFLIRASYYEIYNENIHDLLSAKSSDKPLELRESKSRGVYVRDLSTYLVNNVAELERLKRLGDKQRATASTKMNLHSSRSHSIFSITIEAVQASYSKPTSSSSGLSTSQTIRMGRLNLIDLAGSERQAKSGSTGARLKEASRINLSLTCLSLVIRALTDPNAAHVPYRNSKLTRLLSSSLGGNSKTLLIACISPSRSNIDETLNTLRFSSRTKRIKNVAKINEDPKDALLRKYRRQIELLRSKLRLKEQTPDDEALGSLEATTNGLESKELARQLLMLKAKIMVGGVNLLEKVEMHDKLIETSKIELEQKRESELRLRKELEAKQRNIQMMTKSKGSLEGQLLELDEKLKRALQLYRSTKVELRELTMEHEQLKENLLQQIRSTGKEIKFANCTIEDYIPTKHLELINNYAHYDEDSDEWQVKYIALSGNNIAKTRSLVTENSIGLSRNISSSSSSSASSASSGESSSPSDDNNIAISRSKKSHKGSRNKDHDGPFMSLM